MSSVAGCMLKVPSQRRYSWRESRSTSSYRLRSASLRSRSHLHAPGVKRPTFQPLLDSIQRQVPSRAVESGRAATVSCGRVHRNRATASTHWPGTRISTRIPRQIEHPVSLRGASVRRDSSTGSPPGENTTSPHQVGLLCAGSAGLRAHAEATTNRVIVGRPAAARKAFKSLDKCFGPRLTIWGHYPRPSIASLPIWRMVVERKGIWGLAKWPSSMAATCRAGSAGVKAGRVATSGLQIGRRRPHQALPPDRNKRRTPMAAPSHLSHPVGLRWCPLMQTPRRVPGPGVRWCRIMRS